MPHLLDAQHTQHRPWPLPVGTWSVAMRWHDLLFLHWPVPAAPLRALLPPGLTLETFDGSAWIGVVPFRMSGVRPRGLPALPGLSAFPELNLRTYVRAEDKPGVWFFSLDVTSRLAVAVARSRFHLPYHHARMHLRDEGGSIDFASVRRARDDQVGFEGSYRPAGSPTHSTPGSIDAWLTERYCLYAADRRGRLFRGDIHHALWTLQPAEFELRSHTLADTLGVDTRSTQPLAHFSRDLEVVAWKLRAVAV